MPEYIIIYRNEDEVHIEKCTKGELERQLNDGEFEKFDFIHPDRELPSFEEWPSKTAAFIKGEVVMPKPTDKVIVYDLP